MMGGKLAIVSHILPPSWSGQAMSLYRLLADAAPDRYCLISRQEYRADEPSFDDKLRLSGTYRHLHPEPQLPTGQRFGIGRMTRYVNLRYRIARRAQSISAIIRQENCGVVIACSGDPADPPAAYRASRQLGLPFYLHAFDDYAKQWVDPHLRSFARNAERNIMKGTAGVIVPNEFMGQVYVERYGVETILVHNPSLSMGTEEGSPGAWPTRRGEIRIVYTGAIYHAQADAFRNLLTALEMLDRSDLHVHVYTAQTRNQLDHAGIRGSIEIHEHLSPTESRAVQQKADVLFLPLAFSSPIPEIVRTSAPGKMGEYLASGRPVLVHAPADSYVSWYFKEHDCGIVVDDDDPRALASGISSIIEDRSMRKRLIANAQAAAKRDFSLPAVRAAYWGMFGGD
jgi:glycosyltransferase involved in cell wall biosynthesis